MPQAVHVQIVRQIALLQNLFEPECECTRHPRIPAGLPKQIVLFLQPPFTTLLFLPRTFLTGSERHTSSSSVFGFGLPHAGKIPFTRYFGRDFSRYYGLLFRFCWRLKSVPASLYLTVPFGAGGILPAGCSGSVHWSLNTVPVDSSEPLPPGIAAHCPALSVYILPVAQLSDHALRDSYEQAERFFALHASSLYENGKPLAVLCSTGLLWPALDAFLPEDSGIL